MTRYLKRFVKICDQDQCAALSVPIKNGRNDTSKESPVYEVFSPSNSVSTQGFDFLYQEIIWFQAGTLWDASKLFTPDTVSVSAFRTEATRAIYLRTRFDNCCNHTGMLSAKRGGSSHLRGASAHISIPIHSASVASSTTSRNSEGTQLIKKAYSLGTE